MDSMPQSTYSQAPKKQRNLVQSIVEEMIRQIRTSQLTPGDKLPSESAIMTAHGVSRTVVREALSQLQAAGLVQTRHGVGTFVHARPQPGLSIDADSIVTVRDVLAVLELRIGLETEAAGLAALRRSSEQADLLGAALADLQTASERDQESIEADVRFHTLIAQATQNAYFVDMLAQLGNTLIPRARLNTSVLEADRAVDYLERVNREHETIYRAVLRGDPEGARAAMRTHLSNSRERLNEALNRHDYRRHS